MAKQNKKFQTQAGKLFLSDIRYTSNVMHDEALEEMSAEDRQWMSEIFSQLQTHAPDLLGDIETLRRRYPKVICFENWLCLCYRRSGRKEEAREIYERQFRERPDYLFARTSLAELYLEEGDIDAAERLMQPGALTSFYPDRELFHVSELRHWFVLLGKIAFFRLRFHETRQYRDVLRKLEPNSPFADELDRLLSPEGEELLLMTQVINRFKNMTENELKELEAEVKKDLMDADETAV